MPLILPGLSSRLLEPEQKQGTNRTAMVTIEKPQPVVADSPQKPLERDGKRSKMTVFGSTFLTIFLAELGDKTQLSTLLMSAESQSPWVVFVGSAVALVTTSLLGVVLGSWIASRLAPKTVEKAAGVSLLLISVMLFWDVVQG